MNYARVTRIYFQLFSIISDNKPFTLEFFIHNSEKNTRFFAITPYYAKSASLSQIISILQLFIKHTSICHDNLLVLQLNIKRKQQWMSPLSNTMPEIFIL